MNSVRYGTAQAGNLIVIQAAGGSRGYHGDKYVDTAIATTEKKTPWHRRGKKTLRYSATRFNAEQR